VASIQPTAPEAQPPAPASPTNPQADDAAPAPISSQPDQEMADAPPISPTTKVAREREEDETEEPAAKRAKTDEPSPGSSQFKVPELPASSAAPGPPAESTSKPITKPQTKSLIKTIQGLKRSTDGLPFNAPVDPVKLNIPTYPQVIKHPMDLQTIENKLKASQYQTADEVIADVKLMVNNTLTFNGPDHVVSVQGQRLYQSFERHLAKLPGPDQVEPTPAEKKAKKGTITGSKSQPRRQSKVAAAPPTPAAKPVAPAPRPKPAAPAAAAPTTFALGPEGLPLIRRDSTNTDGRPKRSIHPPKNRDFPYSTKPKKKKFQWELKFCQEVLDELNKPKHYSYAAPFYHPVDPVALNIPTYHSIIKKPMDLHTMKQKLDAGIYENAREFEADMRQMLKNCFKFNIPGDPTHTCGKKLEEVFNNKWAQKTRWIEAHEPSSGHHSAGTSDASDDDEEESEDDHEDKLTALQKQIAEMSKQVEAIKEKKKKTPPTTSKKGSKPKNKKDTKKGGGGGKKDTKKANTKAKPEKQRWVTYREKQLISSGIESLPQKKMDEALKIIQNNVPSLNVCHHCVPLQRNHLR
jgi:bromodomain-containing factor 1